jgi:transcriptional regulator with XRE-family HTH domain
VLSQVGKNLLRHRKRRGLSQENLAIHASLHRTEIGLLERGERIPRVDTLIKLAGALGISPGELLDGISWEPGYRQPGQFEASAREDVPGG